METKSHLSAWSWPQILALFVIPIGCVAPSQSSGNVGQGGSSGVSGGKGGAGSGGTSASGGSAQGASGGNSGSGGTSAGDTSSGGGSAGRSGSKGGAGGAVEGGGSGSGGAVGSGGTAGGGGSGGPGGRATTGGVGGGGAAGAAGAGGAGEGGVAGSGGTLSTDCSITLSSGDVSPKMATVGVVEWSTTLSNLASAQIVYTLNNAGASILNKGGAAPVDLKKPNYHTLLLGLKPSSTYTFHVEATTSSGAACKSADKTLSTGALSGAPTITRTATSPTGRDQHWAGQRRFRHPKRQRQQRGFHPRRRRNRGLVRGRAQPMQPRTLGLRGR